MGTGGGCCSFPPLLQLTVAVLRVVKTLATLDVGTWVHRKENEGPGARTGGLWNRKLLIFKENEGLELEMAACGSENC